MKNELLVRGRWIITGGAVDDPVHCEAAVLVGDDGRIQAVDRWRALRERHPQAQVIGSDRFAVLPGLVNAHHHAGGISHVQHGVPDRLLEPWILSLRGRRPGDSRLDTLVSAARLLRSGVTAVVDVESDGGSPETWAETMDRALRAYEETGLRVAFAPGIKNQSHLVAGRGEDARFLAALPRNAREAAQALLPAPGDIGEDDYLDIMRGLVERYRSHPRVDVWFGPPGPQWVSDPFMQRIAEAAQALDTGIQTHVVESFYEKLHGPRFYGQSTVAHLRDLGVLSPRFSIAHGVWLTEEEIAILAETGAAVSHNPSSNLRLRAGIAPLNALLAAGVTVGIGMDGTTLDDDEDMFTEMRLALRLNRTPFVGSAAPTPSRILELATAGGARLLRAMGLGRLAPGAEADLVLVDVAHATWPWTAPEADPRDLVLLRARAGDVHTVLIGGEAVLREGIPTRFDAEAAVRELADTVGAAPYPETALRGLSVLLPHLEAWYGGWDAPECRPYTPYNSRD
ncbi:MAG: amidohydrolase family protein [Gammaproteobacteria bacterium]|nr:amidohydrolase family protein [Gammaproteobacteria bacterium]NIR58740.1 amidohydrolase family protein [Gammaproteobacteria bacterium]NIR88594.1 amidohydrolase family protein [Gammaproteobacteria bacterium]